LTFINLSPKHNFR